jgi:hypothetical protein
MVAIYSNGGNRWNILGFNFTKRDALSSLYKISMVFSCGCRGYTCQIYYDGLSLFRDPFLWEGSQYDICESAKAFS